MEAIVCDGCGFTTPQGKDDFAPEGWWTVFLTDDKGNWADDSERNYCPTCGEPKPRKGKR